MAKRFMFVCVGILALAAAYSLGAKDSVAQSGVPVFAGITSGFGGNESLVAITSEGDIYAIGDNCIGRNDPPYVAWYSIAAGGTGSRQWIYMGNVLEAPVSANSGPLGGVKALFR